MDKKQVIRDYINDLANDNLEYRLSETKEERLTGQVIRLTQLLDKWESLHRNAIESNAIDVELEFLEQNINNTKEQIDEKTKSLGLQKNI